MSVRRSARAAQFIGAFAFTITLTSVASAVPVWYDANTNAGIKPDVPDLYQHEFQAPAANQPVRKLGPPAWENNGGGGWCRETTVVDGLYSLQAAGYAGLIQNGSDAAATWLDKTGDSIIDIATIVKNNVSAAQYLTNHNHGEKKGPGAGKGLTFQQYKVYPDGTVTQRNAAGAEIILKVKTGVGNQMRKETAFEAYKAMLLQDQDVMVRIADTRQYNPPTPMKPARYPLHWWAGPQPNVGNYHYMNGVGIDVPNNILYLADPDSNKGSADANAGWDTRDMNGKWGKFDPAVEGRRYIATDPIPIPARGNAMTDLPVNWNDFYSAVTINNDGFTFGGADRYSGAFMTMLEAIGPVGALKKPFIPAPALTLDSMDAQPPAPQDFEELVDIDSNLTDLVDKVLIYPLTDPASGFSDSLSDDDSWNELDIAAGGLDPWDNVRSYGGFEFDAISDPDGDPDGLEFGEIRTADIKTMADFESFDIMFHDSVSDEWFMQSIGAPEELFGDQQIPEPASVALIGLALLTLRRRRGV